MTWIVGTACPFGYAIGLSDIRVTFPDGSERDCLQKIYPVGRFIAAGFAGSVKIGFGMLYTLTRLLHVPDENVAWIPDVVAQWWPADARDVFGKFPDCEKVLGSQLMILGVHPTEKNDWDSPRSEVYTFSSPNFAPKLTQGLLDVVSIGSGSQIAPYAQFLKGHFDEGKHLQFATMGAKGIATGLGIYLTSELQDLPQPGISPHLHICLVSRGAMELRTNDHETFDADGSAQTFKMPPVATSYGELLRLCQSEGVTANGAVC